MKVFGNESNKTRLETIMYKEIIPKVELLVGPLTPECIRYIISSCRLKQVSKDQYIEESGAYEDGHLHFLYSGIAHSFYYHDESDRTFVTRLWKKDDILFDVNSFVNCEDRKEDIQMLEDGELISIGHYHLKNLLNNSPKLLSLSTYLQIERETYNKFYQHLLKSSVEERLNLFLKHNPTIINRINKDCIAQHLNVSRSRLSTAYAQYKLNRER
ncbi:Crp/Fnr family transcriptional regulator [Pedobacter gandavensis]|uniref:Crp/Fnr family transcriptional regulator n=1 Tax=Pedobacter gandavensis TaxID=2679963 RepID=A0ABR6ET95_9SPHI|nr:Crp/Fnr family transcriptional regulator [Pedobacter gandavensis]MBB2148480.1 hypothetical protein [Pedobacter gandavensis]